MAEEEYVFDCRYDSRTVWYIEGKKSGTVVIGLPSKKIKVTISIEGYIDVGESPTLEEADEFICKISESKNKLERWMNEKIREVAEDVADFLIKFTKTLDSNNIQPRVAHLDCLIRDMIRKKYGDYIKVYINIEKTYLDSTEVDCDAEKEEGED